ncbi:IS701 family transposase [Streptomyces hoynatensis]|uniref:Transposase n=1 Tax=Streptomyces hoynatensis TaxID=1141874 RepID=A0A3A9YIJ0_9ACTN|nr:transposase [Streptomyces hoynatensis]RKN36711.1 transposase [Streptomyces hoynatensis]
MDTVELEPLDAARLDDAMLSAFCEEMLASLSRSDQRRWGKTYVRGLVNVPGRKSIRRISEYSEYLVGSGADQSLQQFLNQSPWSWAPVRSALADALGRARPPAAWVVREVTFPKNGSSSVAVARQYSRSMGRVANCQLATGVFLAGDSGSCPVNWRLHIPREWDEDTERRHKSRVPDSERWRPPWRYVLDAVDEMAVGWRLPRAPVVVDLTGDRDAEVLLGALDDRGIAYVVQVSPTTRLPAAGRFGPAALPPRTVGQVAAASLREGGTTLPERRGGRMAGAPRSLFTLAPAGAPAARNGVREGSAPLRRRHVLADWSWGPARPRAVWLTNLGDSGTAELAGLVRTWDRSAEAPGALAAESGLLHFEGRSFRGWHHHVTLVALAHGFRVLRGLEAGRQAPGRPLSTRDI